ncbi:TPA: ribulose-phosphate 3-epimerase [Pasteurella multocida]|nr:allulose-6-phosphate 3-epimerase [Pasteurella multocida subsp. multocida PMTB2.1]APW57819.1 allulose-6-phosphate 3-epimerase [Pasteurella multocida]AXQ72677.1 allulose-6-phosphate 3-epimerase [Pasteurella multocida subsp. multocida]EJZ78622.1 D-allulose-6-phosphate 3-epimerase [Pasteurella multocida subsp. gallicida X73]QWU79320.1 ribulose-phosphate 3-epimerase [Pasteurella sp. XG20]
MKVLIAPSLMCMDLTKFNEQLEFLDKKVGYFHIDIMDGHFVPNLTLSPFFVSQVRKLTSKPLDCHLMVVHPENYIDELARAGCDMVTLHVETISGQAFRIIDKIQRLGMKVGIIFNPESAIENAKYYLHKANKVTVLTVDPGFAGQTFIPEMLDKIEELKVFREKNQLTYQIEVDGSCNPKTYQALIEAGADVLIVGTSGLFNNADNIIDAWNMMEKEISQY